MKLSKVLVMNGPNLDMLGTREPEVYGTNTLQALEEMVIVYGAEKGVKVSCFQSNSEGKLIKKIHKAPAKYDAIIYNPGAHTHYSYALRDAIGSIDTPVVEVHISDVDAREAFRAVSVTAPACVAQIKGRGFQGYCDALDLLLEAEELPRMGEAAVPAKHEGDSAGAAEAGDAVAAASATADTAVETAAQEAGNAAAAGVDAPMGANAPTGTANLPVPDAAARVARLHNLCDEIGLDAFLVRSTSNIYWLTAFDDVFDAERAHALLVSHNNVALHTDSRYSTNCRARAQAMGSAVSVNDRRMTHAAFARDVLISQGMVDLYKLGIEDDITLAEFHKMQSELKDSGVEVYETSGLIAGLRAVKDASEIARMKAAQAITDAAFDHIAGFIKPGMTELQVKIELEDFMVRHGSQGVAFDTIVACGANGASPHGQAGNRVLEQGQSVVIDFGARFAGYNSDMTRTIFLGAPSAKMQAAWAAIRRANEEVQAMLAPGVVGSDAHKLAESILAEEGFANTMGHGLGHGVGIDIHELPTLSLSYDKPLVAGNVVTVEPGIYLPGEFGMRLEDFGVVTDEGYERFTQSTHEMVII